jgi:YebC/PmpR family DNA-binding regulatory protein
MGTEEGELLKSQKLLGENAAAGMAALVERDGSIWARVDKWAARARELLAGSGDAMYGYFSPVIRGLKNGPLRITSIALTNTPAINGQDLLAASDRGAVIPLTFSGKHQPNPKEKSMKKLLSRLAQLLGHDVAALTDSTDPSPLIEGACGAIETLRAGVVGLADVRGALALADDAKPPAIVGAALAAIEKGKAESMPKDNIENAIKRGTGQLEGVNYEEVRYEGYGIGGVAVMVDCLTDNKTRTVADVRHAFVKHGGNMGTDGCVAFQFKHCGQIILEPGASEVAVMEVALDAGAEDIISNEDGSIEVLTSPDPKAFEAVKEALEKAGFKPAVAEITMRPEAETELAGDDALKMQKILDALESLDDVQEVYTNAVLPD